MFPFHFKISKQELMIPDVVCFFPQFGVGFFNLGVLSASLQLSQMRTLPHPEFSRNGNCRGCYPVLVMCFRTNRVFPVENELQHSGYQNPHISLKGNLLGVNLCGLSCLWFISGSDCGFSCRWQICI